MPRIMKTPLIDPIVEARRTRSAIAAAIMARAAA
jgi:hypothetical protein